MERKIKLVYFLNSIVFAGVEKHVADLINFNNPDIFDIYLLCPEEIVPHFQDAVKADVHMSPVKVRSICAVKQIVRLIKLLKEINPDIVNSHLYFAGRFANPIACLMGVPVVMETAHVVERWRRGYRKFFLLWDIMELLFVDGVIAVSSAVADYYMASKRVPRSKIRVIHNWCDCERFDHRKYTDDFKKKKKNKMGLSPGSKVLTLVGRLEEQKGHRFLIRALPDIRRRFPDIKVIFTGEGSLEDELSRIAERFGVGDCISFLGFVKDVREILLITDIVILPSLFEGLPLTLIEASAMGVPIIASRADGTVDIVLDGETGFLFEPGNVDDLTGKVIALLEDEERAREMGRKGYSYVRKNFDLHTQINETQRYYIELLQNNKAAVWAGIQEFLQ